MRIRTIKPEFFKSETIADLDPLERLLYIGLWCCADANGVVENRPRRIKAEVLPYDDLDVSQVLPRLHLARFITLYEVEGVEFIHINKWHKHQRITGKEAAGGGRYPLPDNELAKVKQPGNNRETPRYAPDAQEQGTGNREQGTGNREQGTRNNAQGDALARSDSDQKKILDQFELWWKKYDRKKAKAKALVRWKRMTDGERQACLDVVDAFVASTPDPQYRPHPVTYLNACRWEDEIDRPSSKPMEPEEYDPTQDFVAPTAEDWEWLEAGGNAAGLEVE